ncbi:MAG: hypothetical protein ACOX0K_06200 [Oscillospiraceae bacterium]|jgi:hypothetical protein
MQKICHAISETLTALLLAAALLLGGMLLSAQVLESNFYRKSQIIRLLTQDPQQSPGMVGMLTDSRNRAVLMKFAGAVANGYVNFELIPVNEAETFSAVYQSLGPVVEVEEFIYHRRNLVIVGTAPDEAYYRELLRRLRSKEHFEAVTGHYYLTTDDIIRFEIECVPAQ